MKNDMLPRRRWFSFFALLLSAFVLSHCAVAPPPQASRVPEVSTVVLVHGLYGKDDHMATIQHSLRAAGFVTLNPSLVPSDGSVGIEVLARQLKDYIDTRLTPDQPVQIVGHSMGGLVARYYLEELGGAARCRGLYTIATPHHGTQLAYLHPGPAGRQMEYQSAFVRHFLGRNRPSYPIICYQSSNDYVILPNQSATLPFATNVLIQSPGHVHVSREKSLLEDLKTRIAGYDAAWR